MHANVTGNLEDMEYGRVISRMGSNAGGGAPPPRRPVARTVQERDLGLFLAYQNSPRGKAQQNILTAESKRVADAAGGHDIGSGEKISSVYHRIMRRLAPNPGRWLLQHPMSDERLAGMCGAPRKRLLCKGRALGGWLPALPVSRVPRVRVHDASSSTFAVHSCCTSCDVQLHVSDCVWLYNIVLA